MNPTGKSRIRHLERGEKLPVTKGICRVCTDPLPKNKRSFCTNECREALYLAISTDYLRARTFERDRGVCFKCELDCDALEQRVFGFSTMLKKPRFSSMRYAMLLPVKERTEKVAVLKSQGFTKLRGNQPRTLWEADHVEPLADGGDVTLDNIQTLCQPCHMAKTGFEATWRAKRMKLIGKKQTETRRRFRKMGIR